jgi:hypothetical protein
MMKKLAATALMLLACGVPLRAQEYGGGVLSFLSGGDRAETSAFVMPGRAGAPSLAREELNGSGVVARGAADRWTVSGRASELELGATPVVLANGATVPRKLYNVQAGGGYARDLGDRNRWGGSASLGSASDRPFNSFGEVSGGVSAYYQKPSGDRASWVFLLNYSNNRPFLNNVPIPGVAYLSRSADGTLTWAAGFPFVYARWKPEPEWTLTANAFGFGNVYGLEAERRIAGPFSAYARVEREPLQWLRAGRADGADRLEFDSSDARLGARAAAGSGLLDASLGRAYARSFYEDHRSSGRPSDRTRLADAWIASLRASWRWGKRGE